MRAQLQGIDGVREDLITILATVLGRSAAEAKIVEIEQLVQSRAQAGTTAAVDDKLPTIRANVRSEVQHVVSPLFIGAMIVGGVSLVVGVAAIATRRR